MAKIPDIIGVYIEVSTFQKLAEEFMRLASEARANERVSAVYDKDQAMRWRARQGIWERAAQMLEEKLNG